MRNNSNLVRLIFECISNANSNLSLKLCGRWRWCRCRGRCRCGGSDSWSTCRICILRLYFLNRCLECQPRAPNMNMSCSSWKCKCDFWQTPSEIFYTQPHPSTRLHSRLTGDKTQIKRNTSVSVWDVFFWRLDSFNLINCQHVPRLFISHSIQTAYSNIRIRLTKE